MNLLKTKSKKLFLLAIVVTLIVNTVVVSASSVDSNEVNSNNASTAINGTMMQYFEWDLANDGTHWNKVANQADELADVGFTALWLPPAYKGNGQSDVGYGAYDLYDLGEFNQKGTTRTKYGTKAQYLNAIDALHNNGIQVYADIVLNHKGGADSYETVNAIQVNGGNRTQTTGSAKDIGAWTVFNFSGRNNKYSSFKWNSNHFDGVDYDQKTSTNAIYRFNNKSWDSPVDSENVNYDYLMYADVDFDNADVVNELKAWGDWYVDFASLDGFRLDAVKHIDFDFYEEWLTYLRNKTGKELFSVGEYWSGDLNKLNNYITETNGTTSLFDVPLHYNLYAASNGGGSYDMRNILSGTLVASNPMKAVTFVDNHDSQPGQSLQSYVADWFKPLAYTLILTRQDGYPCVFYGDYYGLEKGGASFKSCIDVLMQVRTKLAYGEQHDYFDDANVVGWTREGDSSHPNSGLAALITDGASGTKRMYVGTSHAGETWVDVTGNVAGSVTIGSDGYATFSVNGGSHSVWAKQGVDIELPENEVTIYYKKSWTNTYIHYQIGSGEWTEVPGVLMEDNGDGYVKITIDMGVASSITACFNNGGSTWDNNGEKNYSIGPGTYKIENGSMTKLPDPVEEEETTTKKDETTTTKKEETTTSKKEETTTSQSKVTKPSKVSGLKATKATATSIKLKWNKVSGNVTGYKVYRYNSSTKKYSLVKTVKGKTYFTDTKLKSGKTYKYYVVAYKLVNGKTYNSDRSSIKTACTSPKKVKFSAKAIKNKKVKLSWKKVSGATGYYVYYRQNGTKKWKLATTLKSNKVSYTKKNLKKNKKYNFKVVAYRKAGSSIAKGASNIKTIKVK
ncbi:MAG: alpha-amylase [Lachnospiraceae bacterium]|nr:alpha-amylase [Lachnospiraceae bacterium]